MIKNIFYQFRNSSFIKFRIGAVIISIIVTIGVIMFFPHFFRNTYIVTITNKRIIKHDNIDTYLIYSLTQPCIKSIGRFDRNSREMKKLTNGKIRCKI